MPGPEISLPARIAPPSVGSRRPMTIDRIVDLPQPEWPMMQTNSLSETRRLTLRTMTAVPVGVG
jgi:hypothetical protein